LDVAALIVLCTAGLVLLGGIVNLADPGRLFRPPLA
jgi:hypothetical protein